MPASTTPDSIVYPITTDQVSPLATIFANMATSIQAAFSKRQGYNYRWADATARNAQAGMRVGDRGFQLDTLSEYRYSGSAWILWNVSARSFTPTIAGLTVGNGVLDFRYEVQEGVLTEWFYFTLGTTSTVPGSAFTISISHPINCAIQTTGNGLFIDISTGNYIDAQVVVGSTTTNLFSKSASTAFVDILGISSTGPFTWAAGDTIRYTCRFPTF